MKPFAVWLSITLAAFGALGGSYHLALASSPRRVLVIVDSSFAMQPDWHRVSGLLRDISKLRYTEFGLATEKGPVHGWTQRLSLGKLAPYAPRDFTALEAGDRFPEVDEASRVYFVTNAPSAQTDGFAGWTIVRP